MSKAARVVGYVCVALGGIALVRVLALLLQGRLQLDPAILLLFAGIALLRGRMASRAWVSFYISAVAFIACSALVLILVDASDRVIIGGLTIQGSFSAAVSIMVIVSLTGATFWALYGKPNQSLPQD